MLEGGALLSVGVGNIAALKPLIEQKHLAAGLGRQLIDGMHVTLLHDKYQVRITQHRGGKLLRAMRLAVDALFQQQLPGRVVHGPADQRAQPRAAHLDIPVGEVMTKKVFSRGTAANIADAYRQKPFEHIFPLGPHSRSEASALPLSNTNYKWLLCHRIRER
jgi:hypothetical protein